MVKYELSVIRNKEKKFYRAEIFPENGERSMSLGNLVDHTYWGGLAKQLVRNENFRGKNYSITTIPSTRITDEGIEIGPVSLDQLRDFHNRIKTLQDRKT